MVRVIVITFTIPGLDFSPLYCGFVGPGHFHIEFCGKMFCLQFASVFGRRMKCSLKN